MCLGIPGEVIELHPEQPDLAKVNVSGVRRMINIGLLSDDPPAPGEWVLRVLAPGNVRLEQEVTADIGQITKVEFLV